MLKLALMYAYGGWPLLMISAYLQEIQCLTQIDVISTPSLIGNHCSYYPSAWRSKAIMANTFAPARSRDTNIYISPHPVPLQILWSATRSSQLLMEAFVRVINISM
ncbi:hypothetical protein ACSBR2_035487 [Camellia fascicularis]